MADERGAVAGKRIARERPAVRLTRPVREFLETEISGGIVLLGAVVVALLWANSPWSDSYRDLWTTELKVSLAGRVLSEDLRHWVNDGLMVIFFFVVGLEVKRELVVGELNSARKALLPGVAAVGGMVVPAAIYLAVNPGGEGFRGWGIPMATDIALALGVLALVGRGLPQQLRIFLLSLAIVDDIGAILVIAIFYAGSIEWSALGAAVGLLLLVVLMRRLRVWWVPLYVAVGSGVWLATLLSGVHATIAGVAMGLLAPARALSPGAIRKIPFFEEAEEPSDVSVEDARRTKLRAFASVPVTERLAHVLHPWTSFVVLPVFALANAGVALGADELTSSLTSSVTLGVTAGLVVGKLVGITGSSWVAARLGASLPRGLGWGELAGVAALAGIGFTMSLFIGNLAFTDSDLVGDAKVGILTGSIIAALVGAAILRGRAARRRS